jgi:hypothetical protein
MREIGKIFKYRHIRLKTIKSNRDYDCDGCYFFNPQGGCLANDDDSIICTGSRQNRLESVIFVLIKFKYGK